MTTSKLIFKVILTSVFIFFIHLLSNCNSSNNNFPNINPETSLSKDVIKETTKEVFNEFVDRGSISVYYDEQTDQIRSFEFSSNADAEDFKKELLMRGINLEEKQKNIKQLGIDDTSLSSSCRDCIQTYGSDKNDICTILFILNASCLYLPQNQFPCCEVLIPQPRKELGTEIFEGDSNVHLTNVKAWYGAEATNFAIGGSQTCDIIKRINEVKEWKNIYGVKRIVLQVGGNDFLIGRFSKIDILMRPVEDIISDMMDNFRTIITEYKKICDDIYIVSFPAVSDEVKDPYLDYYLIDYCMISNYLIQQLCTEESVPFVDIFTPQYYHYDIIKVDEIHYNNFGRKIVADALNAKIREVELAKVH